MEAAPAVCRAGEFQFAPLQAHTNNCVQSRALFWCKSGSGTFIVNGTKYAMERDDLYILPWNRKIEYFASTREPMFTAHVHIVPWLRPGADWVPNVPHEKDEPLFDSPDRADAEWPGFEGVTRLHIGAGSSLGRLINYTTCWFRESDRLEEEGRALGQLFVREIKRMSVRPAEEISRRPEELTRLLVHIERCFQQAPTVAQLATIISRSRSHVLKLFRQHLGISPKTFIIQRQMREARELLLSTTLAISEVAEKSGVPDQYHFSKLFRQFVGVSPREFRRREDILTSLREPSSHSTTPQSPKVAAYN